MGMFTNAAMRVSKSGRNFRKKNMEQQKRIARHNIQNIQAEIGFREREDPREQVMLKQNMFARGMGKSTIFKEDDDRLRSFQANRRASLGRALDIANQNYSLIRKQWRFGRRVQWAHTVDDILSLVGGALTVYGGISGNQNLANTGQGLSSLGGGGGGSGGNTFM